jgi:hypothetical protein
MLNGRRQRDINDDRVQSTLPQNIEKAAEAGRSL